MSDDFYRQYLDDMFEREVDAEVSNTERDHVIYAVSKMLDNAKQSVRIFPGDLNNQSVMQIYEAEAVKEAAKSLLSKEGVKLVLVLPPSMGQVGDVGELPFVGSMIAMEKQEPLAGRMEVRQASYDAVEFLENNDFCHPMVVMDDSAYRIEGTIASGVAYVNFGNSKDARRLAGVFDDVLYDDGQELVALGSNK